MSIKQIICFLLIFLFAGSCLSDQEPLPFNKEIIDPSSRLVLVDTLSIEASTVVLDSIPTSGKEIILAGTYIDSRLGKIVSKSYFQVGFPKYKVSKDEFYDSVCLIISYNGYSCGDTTQLQSISVRRLTEKLKLNERNSFYNTSHFEYEPVSLGNLTFYPRPSSQDKIVIGLDNEFGLELFDYISQAQDDEFKEDEFNNFFKGLVLVPDEMIGNSIMGYNVSDTGLQVRIYTHTIENELKSHQINFPVINKNLQFNQITCDWSNNNVFNNHRQKIAIPASETDDLTFIYAGLGMFTKLSFPTLNSMIEFENCVLVKAVLYFVPALGASAKLPGTQNFEIYQTDKNNGFDAALIHSDGSAIQPALSIDELYNEKTWYSFDITDHMIADFSDGYIDPGKALSITFSASVISNSLDQLLVGGAARKITEPRLELLFLFYDPN